MTYYLKNALKKLILWALEDNEPEYQPTHYPNKAFFDFDEAEEEGSLYVPDDIVEREEFEELELPLTAFDRETIEQFTRQDLDLPRATREEDIY